MITDDVKLLETNSDASVDDTTNYLGKACAKTVHGPVSFYFVVKKKEGEVNLSNGRLFTNINWATAFFRAVQSKPEAWGWDHINGLSEKEFGAWLDTLSFGEWRQETQPQVVAQEIVSIQRAGIQVVSSNASFRALGWLGNNEEGKLYYEDHDHYFCFQVTVEDPNDREDDLKVYLYVEDRTNLVPMMEELWEEFVDIQLMVTNTQRLQAVMGEKTEEN